MPVGAYTRQSLGKLAQAPDFSTDFDRRVLANVVSQEENVKAVVTKVQLGEADAGVVYVSDATGSVARHLRAFPIPDAQNVVADYPIAVLHGAKAPAGRGGFRRAGPCTGGAGGIEAIRSDPRGRPGRDGAPCRHPLTPVLR